MRGSGRKRRWVYVMHSALGQVRRPLQGTRAVFENRLGNFVDQESGSGLEGKRES